MERRRSGIVNGDDFCCSSRTNPALHGCVPTQAPARAICACAEKKVTEGAASPSEKPGVSA